MNRLLGLIRRISTRLVLEVEGRLFPQRYNLRICSIDGDWNQYFIDAEPHMDSNWETIIWPVIRDCDFEHVLEIAPGAGRNTEKLAAVSKEIDAVDLNDYAIQHLRQRFEGYRGPCRLRFHQNNGTQLPMLAPDSISLVYCWDAAVHFDKSVVRDYVRELARVMRPGATGFVHHSNLGDAADADIRRNPHWRSNMNQERFSKYCGENRLEVMQQIAVPWHPPINGELYSDCISVFRKPRPPA